MVYVNVVRGARPELAEVTFLAVGTRGGIVLDALTGYWMFFFVRTVFVYQRSRQPRARQ